MRIDDDVRQRPRAYLDAVAWHAKHLSEEDRRDLLGNIESHIYEALEARIAGEATVADLEAVLAEMDPPERYGENDASVRPAKRRPTTSGAQLGPAQPRRVPVTPGDVWRNVAYHVVIPIGILVLLLRVVPRFMAFFANVGERLPFFVALVFRLSYAVCRHTWVVLFLAVPAMALDAFIFLCLARRGGKTASRVWTWAIVILEVALFLALAGALYLPLAALLRTLERA